MISKNQALHIAAYKIFRLILHSEVDKISLRARADGTRTVTIDWKKKPPKELKRDSEKEELETIGRLLDGQDPADNEETKEPGEDK